MKRTLQVLLIAALALFGQDSASLKSTLLYYTGGGDLEYICEASAVQPESYFTRAAATLTSITDAANAATLIIPSHGLRVGNKIRIDGATGDTDLNGEYYVQTAADGNTITVTTANVTDAAYIESTLRVTTTAPRSTAAVWDITKLVWSGTTITDVMVSVPNSICANRATTTGATKITWR